MPYKQTYVPAPKNLNLPVYKQLPDGIEERERLFGLSRLREARGTVDGHFRTFYFCPDCDGWIEGHANAFNVNTLNPSQLAGRSGTEYFCARCGYYIDFSGMVS